MGIAIMEKKATVDSFLENFKEGDKLKFYICPSDKAILEDYVYNHPKGGKEFVFYPGIFKTGCLEKEYYLQKKS